MKKNIAAGDHAVAPADIEVQTGQNDNKKHKIDPIPVVLSQHWYYHRYGIDFSENTWTDPEKRIKMYADMS
ncbi:MAG: hypothetical protein FWD23_08460, partial [Oscillospiraceae bacterium]|nr:hypothetical protein [Oscillospiraceae bacterium]